MKLTMDICSQFESSCALAEIPFLHIVRLKWLFVKLIVNVLMWGHFLQELDMLGYEISKTERSLIYILTLGVIQPYRNSGIGIILTTWKGILY